jgi:hypothetical protein
VGGEEREQEYINIFYSLSFSSFLFPPKGEKEEER